MKSGLLPIYLCLLVLISAPAVFGQEALETEEDIYEAYYDGRLTGDEFDDLLELYYHRPDLNGPDLDLLTRIPGVDRHQVERIRTFRKTIRRFTSPAQLEEIADIDPSLIMPFVQVRTDGGEYAASVGWSMRQYLREDESYSDEWRMQAGWSDHLTVDLEADDGFSTLPRRSLRISNISYLQEMVAGTYSFSRGQHLVFGGANNISAAAADEYFGLQPDSGSTWITKDRTFLFDGCKLVGGKRGVSLSLVYAADQPYACECDHGTIAVGERLWGGNAEYAGKRCTWGISGLSSRLKADDEQAVVTAWGPYLSYAEGPVTLFGEAAAAGEWGAVAGVAWKEGPCGVRITYRHYQPGFNNPYSRGEADSDGDDNDRDEQGWTARTDFSLGKRVHMWGSTDFWRTISEEIYNYDARLGIRYKTGNRGNGRSYLAHEHNDMANSGKAVLILYSRYTYRVSEAVEVQNVVRCRRSLGPGTPVDYDGYAWCAADWKITPWWTCQVRLKGSDNDFGTAADGSIRLYLSETIRTDQGISVYAQYIYTRYEAAASPATHQVRITAGWRYD